MWNQELLRSENLPNIYVLLICSSFNLNKNSLTALIKRLSLRFSYVNQVRGVASLAEEKKWPSTAFCIQPTSTYTT